MSHMSIFAVATKIQQIGKIFVYGCKNATPPNKISFSINMFEVK